MKSDGTGLKRLTNTPPRGTSPAPRGRPTARDWPSNADTSTTRSAAVSPWWMRRQEPTNS